MVTKLTEQVDLQHYDDEDFYDAFFQLFREWLRRNKGQRTLEYPMSYLLKNYSKEFIIHYLGQEWFDEHFQDDEDYALERWGLLNVIREIIKRSKYSLPKLIRSEKFTDKYGQVIQDFLDEESGYPFYVDIKIEEPHPHYFKVSVSADLGKYLKDSKRFSLSSSSIERKLKNFMSNFLGLEFGYLKHGQAELHVNAPQFTGVEEWTKKQLTAVIKKAFKELPESKYVKAVRFELNSGGADLTLVFNSGTGWGNRSNIKNAYKQKLADLGYGPNLDVETT